MERIDFQKQKIPFTQVANGVLYDTKLSLGAKAIYAFMYSKPDGWQFSAYRIGQELKVSKTTVLKHLNELKEYGYLISQKLPDGRMLYKVIFPPIEPESTDWTLGSEPESRKATVQKSHGAKSSPISNKEIIVISKESNTSEQSSQIVELIDLFSVVNPSYKKWYANKTQRVACQRLIDAHGMDRLKGIIAFLPKSNTTQYMPVVTTPVQLEDKFAQLASAWQKIKNKQPIIL